MSKKISSLFWSNQAIEQYDEAFLYLIEENPKAVEALLNEIIKTLEHLESFPKLGQWNEEYKAYEIILQNFPFRFFYEIQNEEMIEIITFLHTSQMWEI